MAMGTFIGFGGFNQANQAKLLQQQLRLQRGQQSTFSSGPHAPAQAPSHTPQTPGPAAFPSGPNQANQAALLQQQVSDQLQAQEIFRQIAQEEQAFKAGRPVDYPTGPQATSQPQFHTSQGPMQMNFMQVSHVLNSLMQMMSSFSQLGNGFSSFMGGGQVYPQAPSQAYHQAPPQGCHHH